VLNYDFFQYYQADSATNILIESSPYYGSAKSKTAAKSIEELQSEISRLKTELKNQEIAYLKKINEILEKKLGK
jgi:hypothetical protein